MCEAGAKATRFCACCHLSSNTCDDVRAGYVCDNRTDCSSNNCEEEFTTCSSTDGTAKSSIDCICGSTMLRKGQICNIENVEAYIKIPVCAGNGELGIAHTGCSCCDETQTICSVAYDDEVCLDGVKMSYTDCVLNDGSAASAISCKCGTKSILPGEVCNYLKAPLSLLQPCGYDSTTGNFDGAGRNWKTQCACCNPDKTDCHVAGIGDTCTTAGDVEKLKDCEYVDGSKKTPVECKCGSAIILPNRVCYTPPGSGNFPEELQKCKKNPITLLVEKSFQVNVRAAAKIRNTIHCFVQLHFLGKRVAFKTHILDILRM